MAELDKFDKISESEQLDEQLNIEVPMEPEQWKLWLFKENIRLSTKEKELDQMKEQFDKEKEQFLVEMKEWTKKIQFEKSRLNQENKFFEKKFKLLEQGFKQLAADKDKFAAEKRSYEYHKQFYKQEPYDDYVDEPEWEWTEDDELIYFKGVRSLQSVKKRYKELMKIYHPDNACGDSQTVRQISKEYEFLKKIYEKK